MNIKIFFLKVVMTFFRHIDSEGIRDLKGNRIIVNIWLNIILLIKTFWHCFEISVPDCPA